MCVPDYKFVDHFSVMSHEAPAAIDDDELESAEKFADSGFIDSSSLNTDRKLPRHRYSKVSGCIF